MSDKIIGTCSLCGGPVTIPANWMGTTPPVPSCRACGAIPEKSFGPIISMRKPAVVPYSTGGGNRNYIFELYEKSKGPLPTIDGDDMWRMLNHGR